MIQESSHFYKSAAQKNDLSSDLVKSVGDTILKDLSNLTKNCPNLIITIQGLGRRFLRRKKMRDIVHNLELTKKIILEGEKRHTTIEDIDSELTILNRLLAKYDLYVADRQRVKSLRYETQASNQSSIPQGEVLQASNPNKGKYQRFPTGKS